MKLTNIPEDIKAEILAGYLQPTQAEFVVSGPHHRNAFRDILSISSNDDGKFSVRISRKSLYDILPEALFHPFNRFDSIPADNYKERFADECRKQRAEEESARAFFKPFDRYLFSLGCLVNDVKQRYADDKIIADIICDRVANDTLRNRFVRQAIPYIPLCKHLRGNRTLLSIMIRKILMQEGIELAPFTAHDDFRDDFPRYNCTLDSDFSCESIYLGNQFAEDVMKMKIHFWSDDDCDDKFPEFVSDIKVFEEFLNDFFMGLESKLIFDVTTDAPPVRLSDHLQHNYLNYNTNL